MRYQLPQFIDVEDRIVGFLTAKQFAWLLGGVGFCVPFYFLADMTLFIVSAIIIMGIAIAFAFVRPFGRPFSAYVRSILQYLIQPKLFLWNKDVKPVKIDPEVEKKQYSPDFAEVVENTRKDISDKRLKILAEKLDAGIETSQGTFQDTSPQVSFQFKENDQLNNVGVSGVNKGNPQSPGFNPYGTWQN